jgi:hypothetical protein
VKGAIPDRHNIPCQRTLGVRRASDVMAEVAVVMYKFDVVAGHAACAEFQVRAVVCFCSSCFVPAAALCFFGCCPLLPWRRMSTSPGSQNHPPLPSFFRLLA